MATAVKAESEQTFENNVLKATKPALVDFWASWCGPCRMLAPTIDAVASEMEEQISVFKVNVDENPALAKAYKIQSIPALLLFQDGKEVRRVTGNISKQQVLDFIKNG
jgi:thioredoxin 1